MPSIRIYPNSPVTAIQGVSDNVVARSQPTRVAVFGVCAMIERDQLKMVKPWFSFVQLKIPGRTTIVPFDPRRKIARENVATGSNCDPLAESFPVGLT